MNKYSLLLAIFLVFFISLKSFAYVQARVPKEVNPAQPFLHWEQDCIYVTFYQDGPGWLS